MTKEKLYYGWIVLAVAFVTMGIVSPAWFSFSLFYPPILKEFGWRRADTAGAYSLNLMISAMVSPLVGLLIDRYGPRVVMPIGALVMAVGFVGSGQIQQLWHFYVWFGAVSALGFCAVQVVPNTAIVSKWFVRNRATALGIIMSSLGLGRLAFFPLVQYMISHVGWRTAYAGLGALIAVIVAPLILVFQRHKPADLGLENHPEVSADAHADSSRRQLIVVDREWAEREWTLWKAAKTFRFWALALLFAAGYGGTFVVGVQAVAYLTSAGISSIAAASFIGLQGLMSTFGNFAGGILSDRIGREKTLTLAVVIYVAGLFVLSLIESYPRTSLLYGYAIFFGIGFGMSFPAIMAASADIFQGKRYGSIFGAMTLIGSFGGALGAWLGGYLYDVTGGYRAMFVVTMSVVAASALFIWSARPSKVRVVRKATQPVEATS
jgi:MFS family permease